MTVKSIDDLAKLLKGMGYSPNASNEILKWYKDSTSSRKA